MNNETKSNDTPVLTVSETGSMPVSDHQDGKSAVKQELWEHQSNMIRPKIAAAVLLVAIGSVGLMLYVSRHPREPSVGTPAGQVAETTHENQEIQATEIEPTPLRENPTVTESGAAVAPRKLNPARNSEVTSVEVRTHTNSVFEIPNGVEMPAEARDDLISTKVGQLQELSRNDDRASMESILAEIKSSYSEVRAEAVEAIIQFRSRDAIPTLKELAAQTEDPKEKLAILEAVEFLELPTLEELRGQVKEISRQKAGAQAAPQK